MSEASNNPTLRLAKWEEREKLIDFINKHFGWKLPLINRREFFNYYFCGENLQFALAERDGELLSVAGYILANKSEKPDVWVSVWVAKKGENGVGLELMNALPELLNAKVVACNNIKEKTCVFYQFLGWEAERLSHFYRLGDKKNKNDFKLVRFITENAENIDNTQNSDSVNRLAVNGELKLLRLNNENEIDKHGLPQNIQINTPIKDIWYLKRRYFNFPHYSYDVFAVLENKILLAYLVTRTAYSPLENGEIIPVLRIVDFIGSEDILPQLGTAIDELISTQNAEYADCYCTGISAETFAKTGFSERKREDAIIIPNYLDPPLFENTEYFYFTNIQNGFKMFKADGDQDRPNLTI